MKKSLVAVALLCAVAPVAADTVTLNNGDKITGTISEVNPTSVIVDTPYAGKLTIDRTVVKTLQSDQPVNVIHAPGDATPVPLYLSPSPEGKGWLETATAPPPPLPGPPRATGYLYIGPSWMNQLSLGIVNTAGNDDSTSFSGDLTLHYEKKPDEFTLKFSGVYAVSNGRQNAGLFDQNAVYRHDVSDKLYLYVDDDARYDAIKGISLQATATTGAGYWIYRSDKFKLDVRGGPGATYLKTFDGHENIAAAAEGAIRAAYVINDHMTATHETSYVTSLCDMRYWRVNSETALQMKLDVERGLGLKLAFDDSYENKPAAGRKNNDTRITLSLTLDF